ncbi:MAG: Maf family nucleotide pyrophosphatase [Bacteroidales bacterium]
MLLHKLLEGKKLVLASNSPRRRQLLGGLDVNFEVWSANHDNESFPNDLPVELVPLFLARQKATPFQRILTPEIILITCDTVVLCNNQIVGKPANYNDAYQTLKLLSGSKHTVITGTSITSSAKSSGFRARTDVYFRNITDEEIHYYINKYSPYDKAGAYGIQEWIGYVGIERIDGSYFNVMGLPVQQLHTELINFLSDETLM